VRLDRAGEHIKGAEKRGGWPSDTPYRTRKRTGYRFTNSSTFLSSERRPTLARLWQAHGIKVLLAVDPALQAVDADLYPYVSVYAERDRFGILIPGNWRPGFEVFDLALGLHDYVFGREALIGFGKETHKRGQAGCSLPVIQLISTG